VSGKCWRAESSCCLQRSTAKNRVSDSEQNTPSRESSAKSDLAAEHRPPTANTQVSALSERLEDLEIMTLGGVDKQALANGAGDDKMEIDEKQHEIDPMDAEEDGERLFCVLASSLIGLIRAS
jgi:hypothetical protein